MDKVLAVACREFLATVRTKAFLLSVLLMPMLIALSVYGTQWTQGLAQKERMPTRRIAVVDHTGDLAGDLGRQFEQYNTERPTQPFEIEMIPPDRADLSALRAQITSGRLYGYVVVAADAITADGGCELARRDQQLEAGKQLEQMINQAVINARYRAAALDPVQLARLSREVPVRPIDPASGEAVRGNQVARFLTPFVFMLLLFMGTFSISQGLLTSLIEEKGSRVVEVLLSAVSPTQLMAGKILGTVLVGFVLLALWGSIGVGSAQKFNVSDVVNGYRLGLAMAYFVPGFLLMSAMLAAIGSACNELKDAQSMVFPLSLMTIIPMMFWFYLVEHPSSVISVLLSYIPPITPFVMVLRICADPGTPAWQIISTLALLWAAVLATIWAAGKIFRVGVLMYGKPPSLRELVRWVRYT